MKPLIVLTISCLLGACVYAESPDGRYAAIDLPVQSSTTVHKTVTVNAPPGTVVNISETPPAEVIYRNCYYDRRYRQRVCR